MEILLLHIRQQAHNTQHVNLKESQKGKKNTKEKQTKEKEEEVKQQQAT